MQYRPGQTSRKYSRGLDTAVEHLVTDLVQKRTPGKSSHPCRHRHCSRGFSKGFSTEASSGIAADIVVKGAVETEAFEQEVQYRPRPCSRHFSKGFSTASIVGFVLYSEDRPWPFLQFCLCGIEDKTHQNQGARGAAPDLPDAPRWAG